MAALPTDRSQVYNYAIDWDLVARGSIVGKLTVWINDKVSELLGMPEETMVEFITGKLALREQPSQFVADLADVFGEQEADDFTYQLWLQLLFEHEKARRQERGERGQVQ